MTRHSLLTWTMFLIGATVHAQSTGDHRSAQSGDWSAASTWQRFDGSSFVAAPAPPSATDGQVVILAGHTVTASTPVTIDQVVVAAGGTLVTSGGTFTVVDGPGNDLSVNGTWQWNGATVEGPGTIVIANNGTLTWTNGSLGATGIIDVLAGSTVTYNATGNNVSCMGTINNAGTWNMEGGVMGQVADLLTGPKTFNNLPGGVLNLINWFSSTAWRMVMNNQGAINKNSGTTQFTFSNSFGPNPFANLPGGTVNLGIGNLAISAPAPVQGGTFNLATGTSLFIPDVNYTGPGIVNNGTISGGVFRFQGTTTQTLDGTGTFDFLAIDNAAGVDLGGDQTVTNTLTLTNGPLRLGDHDLLVQNTQAGAISGGSATSWVQTLGAGRLSRQVASGLSIWFPVGTTNYTPLLMIVTNSPQETFSVRVREGVSTEYGAPGDATGSPITSDVVDRTWILEEQTPGGQTMNMAVEWPAANELSLFNRSACRVTYYDGTNWMPGATGAASGTGPYTRSFIGLTKFGELCVSDTDADLNGISTGVVEDKMGDLRAHPVPASDLLFIDLPEDGGIYSLMLFDAHGRKLLSRTMNSGGRRSISVQELPAGMYTLMLVDAEGQWHRRSIAIVH